MPGSIESLNQIFAISGGEAGKLWKEGVPLPENTDRGGKEAFRRIRRSQNGNWIIRQTLKTGHIPQVEAACAHARNEFARLVELGLNVVSLATTPANASAIYTVSPWIPDLEECPIADYQQYVVDPLVKYYAPHAQADIGAAATPFLAYDITHPHQYSVSNANNIAPFLHDADPLMRVDPLTAKDALQVLCS